MTALEKMKEWIATYPGYDILGNFYVDFTDQMPSNGGIYPAGVVELSRTRSILDEIKIVNQINFSIYTVFSKAPQDDGSASFNAEWVADFQLWAQEQSVLGKAPIFGDVPRDEIIMAQNGVMFEADKTLATYMVQISVQYTKRIKEENKWLT